jgi:signal transduction histidine kinase
MVHPDDRYHSSKLLNEAIDRPSLPRSWDARIRSKDGSYCWVESTASNLIEDLEVQAIVMHQRDVHVRVEAQQKSEIQAKELVRSNLRMEEFAYTVAHDLREPLRAISLYTEVLFSKIALEGENEEMAQFVMDGAKRMTLLVSDLLAFARSGMPGPAVPVSLEEAVAQARQNLTLQIRESDAVITVEPLPEVFSDQLHLVRIFQNLISNAMKYRSERPLEIVISAEQHEHDCVIKVRDNGVGIAAEYQKKIFEPFVRLASRDVPGTGLGLAVCQKAIDGLGGDIWVESEVGAGSTFVFRIPSPGVGSGRAMAQHAG